MKTKQEQIEKMTSIIVETLQDKRVENGTTFVTYLPSLFGNNPDKEKEVAEALIENGYGDISEYKAEIERLKSEIIKQDQVIIERNFELVELEDKIKQAKIDVLNTARERCDLVAEELEDEIDHYGSSAAYSCAYGIKKLIKEIENEN